MLELSERVDLESASLEDVERFIAPRTQAFVEVGLALLAIRERRLYLEAGFDRFEDYCRQRWEMDRIRAYQLCEAAQVSTVVNTGQLRNERQARELAPLLDEPDELRAVWAEALERGDGEVTASLIREIRRDRERQRQPAPPPPPPLPDPDPEPAAVESAYKIFTLLTQAAEEVRALGGSETVIAAMDSVAGEVAESWRAGFRSVISLAAELESACER